MKVVIAEKPSVAKSIASVIGASYDKKEWLEGEGYCVTWLYGHLLELYAPEAQVAWARENLPIIPRDFKLVPKELTTKAGQRPRLDVIRDLFDSCDEIIVATDAGREGELIFRNLYSFLACRKPFRRLWISSLTDKAIKEGFENLRDGSEFDNLALAAIQRNQADWIFGINATRALSVACECSNGFVLSLGRVQTPTLGMICNRFIENRNFKSEPFWFLDGASVKDGLNFRWRSVVRFTEEEAGRKARESVFNQGYLVVDKVETKSVTENAPLLFDIDALQKAANAKYGYTLDESLAIAQSLYEKKFTTYPRTSSRYVPEDVFDTVPDLLKTIVQDENYGSFAQGLLDSGKLNRRSVDDEKITDHHAIIITGNKPSGLTQEEANVYELVLIRFLEAFSPVCLADKTTVEFLSGDVRFYTKGRKDVSLGWRAVAKNGDFEDVKLDEADEVEMSMRPLPQMQEGDRINIGKLDLVEDKTKPKPLLTDSTLLTLMETAGRSSDDKDVVDALRDVGIGTAATRAETLKTLVTRKYVIREKKKLIPTDLGLEVYAGVKDMAIANVEMTARWEIALKDIEDGKRDALDFEEKIKQYAIKLTAEILNSGGFEQMRKMVGQRMREMMMKCPRCGKPLRLGEKSVWCNEKEGGCGLTLWREVAHKKLSDTTIRALVEKGETGVITGFKGKDGKEFDARLLLDKTDGSVKFDFPKAAVIKCPKCGRELTISEKGAFCIQDKGGCGLTLWRNVAGKKLTDAMLTALATRFETGVLSGFVSKSGKNFDAKIILDRNNDFKMTFDLAKAQALKCPKCGRDVKLGGSGIFCRTEEGGCGLSIWRSVSGKVLSDAVLMDLIKDSVTGRITGFVSKSGKSFDAAIRLDENYKMKFDFEHDK